MRIKTGSIGTQEAAAMLGLSIYTGAIFTMDSGLAYSKGNSSYIWLPLSMLLSLCAALFIMHVMERANINTLSELLRCGFTTIPGSIAAVGVMVYTLALGYFIVADFVNMVHSFVFYDSGYWEIAVWIILTVFFISTMGFESIGRTALFFAPVIGVVMVITVAVPFLGYRLERIFPLPGNTLGEMSLLLVRSCNSSFWAMMGMLALTRGIHGVRVVRKAVITGTAFAAVLALLTQLAISLTFSYIDLSDMFFPLYRLDMMMTKEGYFFRMDKLLLFFWLIAALISAAYYVYAAAALWCGCFGPRNTLAPVMVFCTIIACGVLIQAEGYYEEFKAAFYWGSKWGWAFALLPVAAAAIQIVLCKRKEKARA